MDSLKARIDELESSGSGNDVKDVSDRVDDRVALYRDLLLQAVKVCCAFPCVSVDVDLQFLALVQPLIG